MRFVGLLKILILRNLREEKFLTLLSILGIALGIGLFTGVKAASDRAISSFESDIRGLTPYANYEIRDAYGVDFDERIYRNVRLLAGESFPVIKTFAYVPASGAGLELNGIDLVRSFRFPGLSLGTHLISESSVRDKGGSQGSNKGRSLFNKYHLEDIFRVLNGILITKRFADRHSLRRGDTVRAQVYDKQYPLKVVGILESDFPLVNTAIMDLGNFQEYFGKTGFLSRIDLSIGETTAAEIRRTLPPGLSLEKKEEVFGNQKALIASFRYNLQFMSLIAVLVGVFLLYNTVFITVVKRRAEIGILRGLGMERKTVVVLFTLQGIILGVAGSLLGILFGQLAAYFSVVAVEKTISTLYSTISISDYLITRSDAATAILGGMVISLLASAVPAFEASKINPNETSRKGSFEGRYLKYRKAGSAASLLFLLLGTSSSLLDYAYTPFRFPVLAYIGIFFIIAGFTLISPLYLGLFLRVMKRPVESLFKGTGKIALGDMRGSPYRFSVALMSVAVSSALIIAFLTLIFSLRDSLTGWINKNVVADVYIKPDSCKANYCFYPISEEVIEAVRGFPEVEGIDRFRAMQVDVFGKKVIAAFADVGVKRRFLSRRYADGAYERVLGEMEGRDPVAGISEYLSIKYGLKKGDTISLKSPAGIVRFRINDVSSSYATTSGFIYIGRKWLKRYWGLDDATQLSIYLRKGVDPERFIHKLADSLPAGYSLDIMNNRELRDRIMDIFNKSFAITYAIEFISIIVSLIGVVTTLLALVFERKREIGIIRYLGGSWKQIGRTLILSAGVLGIAGILWGSLLGPIMSVILIFVVNKISFGWEIHFRLPLLYLGAVTAVLFLTTLFAGLLPAKIAGKVDPRRFVSFE